MAVPVHHSVKFCDGKIFHHFQANIFEALLDPFNLKLTYVVKT